ncbi:UDP-glycosyltransferase UGT5 isoform X2 [Diabrotica virgifera virgifera]|uniref:UDP-glucuronosyltransferase n=1 Tax=Diabrotica virgifera virgifera TaxID=50390 RepID=A0ABM5L786_DIAVI|nr:UDP-glycosyltransferase UGT5 isoform X2 [Diabrotica virgifera virgifera]
MCFVGFFLSFAVVSFGNVNAVRILGVFPSPSVSHQMSFQPIWQELSLRGHQVTVITPYPIRDERLSNLTEINVSFAFDLFANSKMIPNLAKPDALWYEKLWYLLETCFFITTAELEYGPVQDLLKSNETFNLVLLQQTHNWNLVYGFAAKFRVPVIGISSLGLFLHSHDALGNPTHPIVSPDMMLNFSGKLSFFDKVQSFLYNIWYRMFYYWYALPKADKIARKYFGDDMPYLGDLEKNISLLLLNVNPIIHNVRPNVPNVIEINQMHIKKRKPLPKDIQDYLDSAPQGVVYFSLGSNVKSANLTEQIRKEIVAGLGALPYKVLWKWETDYLPNKPDNVMTKKWCPQQDILAHPNIKVFVMQGGLQSIEEAITLEVPLVGMPFVTDQPSNIKRIVELGLGVKVDHKTLTRDILKDAIMEVAQNPKYKEEVKKAKSILLDQPMKGVEKAVWWIEYVIRHKGARHLRSPAADMTLLEYFMVDVVLFLLTCVVVALYSVYKLLSVLRAMLRSSQKIKKQ